MHLCCPTFLTIDYLPTSPHSTSECHYYYHCLEIFKNTFVTYIFPQSSYNPIFSYVLLYNFIQLYIKVRGDLEPTILLHCIIVFLN